MSPFPFLKVSSFLSSIFSFFPSFLDPHFTKLCSGRKYNSSLYIWYMELNSLGKYVQIFKIETKIWKWYVWKLYYLDMSYHGWLGHIKFWVGCRLCPLDSINNVKCNVQRHLTWFHGIWHVVRIELQSMIPWRFCVWWNVGTLLDMLTFNWQWGPFLNGPLLATRGGGGVKFAHHIQTLILLLMKRVSLAWVFICIMGEVAKQGVFLIATCLPWLLFFMLNLTRVIL